MKKKWISLFMAAVCMLVFLTGCGRTEAEPEPAKEDTKTIDIVRVASLKGPTSMGLVSLMDKAEKNETEISYEFVMETSADTLLPMVLKGEVDIALVPANVASVLYNKASAMDVESGIVVIDINTLGVLYLVTGNDTISTMKDLEGKTIYLTGKGTTPDYVLNYLLTENQVDDVTLEYKSEAAEVAAVLKENPEAIGLLPQPFATAACMQNESLSVALDFNKEWAVIQGESGSNMVTGVTIARKAFVEEHSEQIRQFMKEHRESIEYVNANPEEAAALIVKAGIVEKEPVAEKAVPDCNLAYLDGEDMKQALSGYLKVLYEQNPESVGGALPQDEFYYE
ncbi:MAG: ABC transporter substrate-binding protein [Lachnospiraceae bacterium]|nr:ABC transporter substrate-binding protein [Lachnospiraceae bacterium]